MTDEIPTDNLRMKNRIKIPVDPTPDSTEAGKLRWEIEDLKKQMADAHDRLNEIAQTFEVMGKVPMASDTGYRYTVRYRLDLLHQAIYDRSRHGDSSHESLSKAL